MRGLCRVLMVAGLLCTAAPAVAQQHGDWATLTDSIFTKNDSGGLLMVGATITGFADPRTCVQGIRYFVMVNAGGTDKAGGIMTAELECLGQHETTDLYLYRFKDAPAFLGLLRGSTSSTIALALPLQTADFVQIRFSTRGFKEASRAKFGASGPGADTRDKRL